MMMRTWLVALLVLWAAPACAGELRPFERGSLAGIERQFSGRPFILTLWALDCHHCARELQLLGRLSRRDPRLPLVIVATDSLAQAPEIHAALKRFGLERFDTWVFADPVADRLRYAIDPAWRGELPRTYLFDAAHRREAQSGAIGEKGLVEWLKRNRAGGPGAEKGIPTS